MQGTSSLKDKAAFGVKWMGISRITVIGIEFVRLSILAHLLIPDDFGLLGMLMVVIGFAQAFGDMGVSNAIIYHQDDNREILSSLYWVTMITGLVVFILVWAGTPLVVNYYKETRLTELMFWVSLIFIITPIGQQFQMLLQKEFEFDSLAKIEIGSAALGTIAAILLALMGWGVLSLIWGLLVSTVTKALLCVLYGWKIWRPKLHFKKDDLKGYISFGLYQMGERSVNYFSSNVDFLIIGRFLGAEILGIYTVAYRLVTMPISKLNPAITRVAFPIFAKKQSDDSALSRGYIETIKLISLIACPLLIGLAVTSPLLVPLLFGEEWASAIYLIQILTLLGIMRVLADPTGSVLLAKGRADICFKINAVIALINTVVFWYFVQYGVYAIAWSFAILCFFYLITWMIVLHFIINMRLIEYMSVLIKPIMMSLIMGATLILCYILLSKTSLNKIAFLSGLIVLGMVEYILMTLAFEKDFLRNMWKIFFIKKKELNNTRI